MTFPFPTGRVTFSDVWAVYCTEKKKSPDKSVNGNIFKMCQEMVNGPQQGPDSIDHLVSMVEGDGVFEEAPEIQKLDWARSWPGTSLQ